MVRKKLERLLRVFAPFTILLVVILVLNFTFDEIDFFQEQKITLTPRIIDQPAESVTAAPIPTNGDPALIAPAIANANVTALPTGSPEATPTPLPTLLPNDIVTLTGPPAESRFSLSSPLTFYWFSEKPLSEGEVFKFFLADDTGEQLVGTVSEPNMGTAYQVNFIPKTTGLSPGEYYWEVKLIQQEGDLILGESDRRSISLVGAAK